MEIVKTIKKHLFDLLLALGLLILGTACARTLISGGYVPTHDGEYHIIRLWQFDRMVRAGFVFPRWAPDLDFGYGVPLFNFFYPLPNYIGELFRLFGASNIYSIHLVLASGLIVSGLGFYLWIRTHFSPWPSFAASASYILAPYHSVDVFIRGSVGEVWALALSPFLFWSVSIFVTSDSRKRKSLIGTISLFTALVLLSHNLIGVLMTIFSVAYGLVFLYLKRQNTLPVMRNFIVSYLLGILLVAFYYVPVIFESSYIRGLDIVSPRDHFPALFQLLIPSWGSGFSVSGISDKLSFQIGLVHIAGIVAALVVAAIKRNYLALFFVFSSIVTILFMLNWSDFIWSVVPGLKYIQYPWRLLSLVIITGSFCIGYISDRSRGVLVPIFLILIIGAYWGYTEAVVYEKRQDEFFLSNPDWAYGTATLGNTFTTRDAVEKGTYPKAKAELRAGVGTISEKKINPVRYRVETQSAQETTVLMHINYYPGWVVILEGAPVPIIPVGGMISFQVPPGKHSIIVQFTDTTIRRVGTAVSIVGLVIALYLIVKRT